MYPKSMIGAFLVVVFAAAVPLLAAQSLSIDWISWDAQITAHAGSTQLSIVETQNIRVTKGVLHKGERDYSGSVNIETVYFTLNNQLPLPLSKGSGSGQYQVSTVNGELVLTYTLPAPATVGDSFDVQINYTVEESAPGVIDWYIVPGTHSIPIDSSTATFNFPDGHVPSQSLVLVPTGQGVVSTSGNSIVVKSEGAIPANSAFEVQIPYSAVLAETARTPQTGSQNPDATAAPTAALDATAAPTRTPLKQPTETPIPLQDYPTASPDTGTLSHPAPQFTRVSIDYKGKHLTVMAMRALKGPDIDKYLKKSYSYVEPPDGMINIVVYAAVEYLPLLYTPSALTRYCMKIHFSEVM